jgi:hypothetical protein
MIVSIFFSLTHEHFLTCVFFVNIFIFILDLFNWFLFLVLYKYYSHHKFIDHPRADAHLLLPFSFLLLSSVGYASSFSSTYDGMHSSIFYLTYIYQLTKPTWSFFLSFWLHIYYIPIIWSQLPITMTYQDPIIHNHSLYPLLIQSAESQDPNPTLLSTQRCVCVNLPSWLTSSSCVIPTPSFIPAQEEHHGHWNYISRYVENTIME